MSVSIWASAIARSRSSAGIKGEGQRHGQVRRWWRKYARQQLLHCKVEQQRTALSLRDGCFLPGSCWRRGSIMTSGPSPSGCSACTRSLQSVPVRRNAELSACSRKQLSRAPSTASPHGASRYQAWLRLHGRRCLASRCCQRSAAVLGCSNQRAAQRAAPTALARRRQVRPQAACRWRQL